MWWRRRNPETDKFVELLLRSGLVNKATVRKVRRGIRADSLDELCSGLVQNGSVTQWQCDKLRAGKHRGFFFDKYKILDHIGKDYTTTTYLAEDLETSERVGLRINPGDGLLKNFTWVLVEVD